MVQPRRAAAAKRFLPELLAAQAPTPLRLFEFIGHEALDVDLPFGLATVVGEGGEEAFAVRVVVEAIDDVIAAPGIRGAVGEA